MAQINMNLTEYEVQEGFDVLPPGWYVAEVVDSEIADGKAGPYIKWTWSIVGKPNRVWNNMSTGNEIACKLLKTMAACCGHRNPNFIQDTEELHGRQCLIKLKVTKAEGYDDKNEITGYKPLAQTTIASAVIPANVPPAHVAAAAIAQPATPPVNNIKPRMPWEK